MRAAKAGRVLYGLLTISCALALGLLASPVQAQLGEGPTPDERVRAALDEAGLKYTVDKDADYKLLFETGNERTQLVFVNSKTESYQQFEIREIWAAAYSSEDPFSADVANKLLLDNESKKIGAWQTKKLGGKYTAVFTAKVAATTNAEGLKTIVEAIAAVADAMELDLTSIDDY